MGCALRRQPRHGTVAGCRPASGAASAAATASTARCRRPSAATCRMRRAGSSTAAARSAAASACSSVSDIGSPRIWCRCPSRGQRVEQRAHRCRRHRRPARPTLAGVTGGRQRDLLPADLVAGIRDRLGIALLVVLCGKPVQDIQVFGRPPRRPSSAASSSIRPSSRSRTASVRTASAVAGRLRRVVAEPVLAVLERVGRQVELACAPAAGAAKSGTWPARRRRRGLR